MSEEEKEETTEEETPVVEEAPAEEAAAPEAAPEPAEPDPLDDLPWKERKRILKSRESGAPGPEKTPEEREADRKKARASKARARRKRRGDEKAERTPSASEGTAPAERTRTGKPKERQGLVTSDKGDKTITVQIDTCPPAPGLREDRPPAPQDSRP